MQPDLGQIVPIVKRIAQEELLPLFACCTRNYKDDGSIITEADLACHQRLQQELSDLWPHIGYLSEENSSKEQMALLRQHRQGLWVVDPLDGSNNFASGIPYFCLSIALVNQQGPQLAVVYDPIRDECFSAQYQKGASLNDQPLQVPLNVPALKQSLLLANIERLPTRLREGLVRNPPYGSIRHFGASALDWCWLAYGRGQLSLHAGQNFWDYAAGLLIFAEAGGQCCSFDQKEVFHFSLKRRSVIAAGSVNRYREWRDIVSSHLT
jgi:myo-inositol-1(or 4)-monophosphatase